MKIVELKREMDRQFRDVDARFRATDTRFDDVNASSRPLMRASTPWNHA